MNKVPILLLATLYFLAHPFDLASQEAKNEPATIRSQELTWSPVTKTSLGSKGTVMAGLSGCAPDGTALIMMADNPAQMDMTLHAISDSGKSTPYKISSLPAYKNISWPTRFFINDRIVAGLVTAEPAPSLGDTSKDNKSDKSDNDEFVTLVLTFNRDSSFEHAVPVPKSLKVKGLGVFASRDILLIAMDDASKQARLHILSSEGSEKGSFSLINEDYNSAKDAKAKQPLSAEFKGGALEFVQVVPNGENLLLVPEMTAQPVIEVNEKGITHTTSVKLPAGLLLGSLLATEQGAWLIKTSGQVTTNPSSQHTSLNTSMMAGPLLEVNRLDGSIERAILPPSGAWANIVCEHNGDFLGLTTDKDSGMLEVETGHLSR